MLIFRTKTSFLVAFLAAFFIFPTFWGLSVQAGQATVKKVSTPKILKVFPTGDQGCLI